MLKTSYFAKSAKAPGAISIARFPPEWYSGACYFPLAPPAELLKIRDWDEYRQRYRDDVLAKLEPGQVLRDLESLCAAHDIILLCIEKERTHCHRGLVAAWFLETTGIRVPELGDESGKQMTLWSRMLPPFPFLCSSTRSGTPATRLSRTIPPPYLSSLNDSPINNRRRNHETHHPHHPPRPVPLRTAGRGSDTGGHGQWNGI